MQCGHRQQSLYRQRKLLRQILISHNLFNIHSASFGAWNGAWNDASSQSFSSFQTFLFDFTVRYLLQLSICTFKQDIFILHIYEIIKYPMPWMYFIKSSIFANFKKAAWYHPCQDQQTSVCEQPGAKDVVALPGAFSSSAEPGQDQQRGSIVPPHPTPPTTAFLPQNRELGFAWARETEWAGLARVDQTLVKDNMFVRTK